MPTHLTVSSCHWTLEADEKCLGRAIPARDGARERAEQASENLRVKEDMLVEARNAHTTADALEKPDAAQMHSHTHPDRAGHSGRTISHSTTGDAGTLAAVHKTWVAYSEYADVRVLPCKQHPL